MKELLCGCVQSGQNDASHWLNLYNDAYSLKTGMSIFPGSLNLFLDHKFNWRDAKYQPFIIWFGREEMGGERDILLLPCRLLNLDKRKAFLWTTTNLEDEGSQIIEIITDVKLRDEYKVSDGDFVEVEILGKI